jgi:hypothetical protein
MTIEQTVEVPASRRLTIDVPREIPVDCTTNIIDCKISGNKFLKNKFIFSQAK